MVTGISFCQRKIQLVTWQCQLGQVLAQLVDTRNLILPEKHTNGYRNLILSEENTAGYMAEGRNGILHRFQQLRSYREETETRNQEEIPFSSQMVPSGLSVTEEPYSDSPPQRRTFI